MNTLADQYGGYEHITVKHELGAASLDRLRDLDDIDGSDETG